VGPMDHHHDSPDHTNDAALAELLDLDGEVLREYWTAALTWVQREATATGHSRIFDLGAGTGVGAIALAQRFAGAEVIAVDVSEPMLSRLRAKALDLGLADRVRTVRADLDAEWPAIEPVDVTWASMSLHHLADPDRVLADVFAATRPGGLIAVAELTEHIRFLPDDLGFGRPGLEARCLDALTQEHAHSLPELGSHWAPRIEGAGFTLLGERTFRIELKPPHSPAAARYAHRWLGRLRSGTADRLAHDDLDAWATLLDGDGPQSLRQRNDLQVRGARTVTLARR
jgi:SAM-dependent methyltransferase